MQHRTHNWNIFESMETNINYNIQYKGCWIPNISFPSNNAFVLMFLGKVVKQVLHFACLRTVNEIHPNKLPFFLSIST